MLGLRMFMSKKNLFVTLLYVVMTAVSIYAVKNSTVVTPVAITKANFSQEITHYKKPVVLIAVSDKSDVCKMLDPMYKDLIEKLADRGKVAVLNIDKNPELAKECGVVHTPTVIFYNSGKVFGRLELNASKEECKALGKHIIGLSYFTSFGYYNFIISLLKKM